MLSAFRAIREYQSAGALNTLFAVWGFINDHMFITKTGDIGVVYKLTGIDAESCDAAQRDVIVHHVYAGLKHLDHRYWVYQYATRRRIAPVVEGPCANPIAAAALARRTAAINQRADRLYDTDLYLVVLQTGVSPSQARGRVAVKTVLSSALTRAVTQLDHALTTLATQWAPLGLTLLDRGAVYQFLSALASYDRRTVSSDPPDTHLDYHLSQTAPERFNAHLRIGHHYTKVLTMRIAPKQTFPHMLEALYRLPGECIICLEWHALPPDQIMRDIESWQTHFYNQRRRFNFTSMFSEETTPASELMLDDSAEATVRQFGEAKKAVEIEQHRFGACSLTVVLFDKDPYVVEASTAAALSVLASKNGQFTEETYNNLWAWAAIMPGNYAHNRRYMPLLDVNVADLSLVFTISRGEPYSAHFGRESLALFETEQQSLYHWNLHYDRDVGNTLILGSIGSGKSYLVNYTLTNVQKYDPLTVVFGMGGDYQKISEVFNGNYLELGVLQSPSRLNPFSLPPTEDHLDFLHRFVTLLLETHGDKLTLDESLDVQRAVTDVYTASVRQRRLSTVVGLFDSDDLTRRMEEWVHHDDRKNGRYAYLFDNVEDTLSFSSFQVFELESMKNQPDILDPMLFYVLYRLKMRLGQQFTLCVLDEAWKLIRNPILREFVEEALLTWRKRNAVLIIAAQMLSSFETVDLLGTVVETCKTQLLLANETLDRDRYRQYLHLNEMELDMVAHIRPKSQVVLKRPGVAKVLTLSVDRQTHWMYANSPVENARFREVVDQHGLSRGLEILAGE